MSNSSPFSRINSAAVGVLRSRCSRLSREDCWQRDESMHQVLERAWPLMVAASADESLSNDFKLETRNQVLLYRLAHPDPFDWGALVQRREAGVPLTAAQRDQLIRKHQERAADDVRIFDPKALAGFEDIGIETRRYLAAASGKKRFEIIDAYNSPRIFRKNLGLSKSIRRPNLTVDQWKVERHRNRWTIEDLFQPLSDLYALWQTLLTLKPAEITDGFQKFGARAEGRAVGSINHSRRTWTLATCIASAKPMPGKVGRFSVDLDIKAEVSRYFLEYCAARKRADGRTKASAPDKALIKMEFLKSMSSRSIP